MCAHDASHCAGHGVELVYRDACLIASEQGRLAEGVGFLAALVVGEAQNRHGSTSGSEGVHQARDIRCQAASSGASCAEHVLELTALLEEDRQRRLARLQRHNDVSELRRHHPHRCSGLRGRHAHLANTRLSLTQLGDEWCGLAGNAKLRSLQLQQLGFRLAQRLGLRAQGLQERTLTRVLGLLRLERRECVFGLAQLGNQGIQLGRIETTHLDLLLESAAQALAGLRGDLGLFRGAGQRLGHGAFGPAHLLGGFIGAIADPLHALGGLLAGFGDGRSHVGRASLDVLKGGLGIVFRRNHEANFAVLFFHHTPKQKGPPKRAF